MKIGISRIFVGILIGALLLVWWLAGVARQTSHTDAASASEFGVVSAISSLSAGQRGTAADKVSEAGFGWAREEFTYANPVDFSPYDGGVSALTSRGVKVLGLLAFPGADKSHDDWKTFVSSVVGHFSSSVSAWEIFNEADTYLSPSDYVTYLNEAHDIIKGVNGSATIVSSGIGSRIEATNFWDGIAAAGGWGAFDAVGLHVYHSGNPEKVNFGGGNLTAELQRVLGSISKNGGGKSIWITETGYKSTTEGEENQANWLARTLLMARGVSGVDKVFIYRLYHDEYGLLNGSLGEKASFGRIKSLIAAVGGKGTGTRLYPQDKKTVDNLDSTSGWKTNQSSNAGVNLSTVGGYSGNGMQISYSFSADSAYALVQKSIAFPETPSAIAAWINGDDTKNVWKFRFKDNNGETFQVDLGSISSGWHYEQFTLGQDTALTSWGGDGVINYPISFDSFVVDRQGGSASASGIVDELVGIYGGADLYAYQFGNTAAWWKVSGSSTANLCGASRSFTESPQYAAVSSCADTSTSSTTGSSGTTTQKPATPKATPIPVDAKQSSIRVDGSNIPADGKSVYKIVVTLKDSSGKVITSQKPSVALGGGQTTLGDFVLTGNEWIATVSSSEPGERSAKISSGGTDLGTLKMVFAASATESVTAVPTLVVPAKAVSNRLSWLEIGALILAAIGVAATLWVYWLRRRREHAAKQKIS